jgi:alternate signal-mediated exported protein
MNKATKGAIAAGAASVLLLGGAGTFALWEDTKTVDAAPISTGVLTLGLAGAGTWYDATATSPGVIENITTFNIVPGDTVTYTTPVTVTAQGDNLKGEFKIEKALWEPANETTAPYIDVSVAAPNASTAGLAVDANGAITVPAAGTYNFDVVITVVFKSTTGGLVGQNTAVDLTALTLKLEQA